MIELLSTGRTIFTYRLIVLYRVQCYKTTQPIAAIATIVLRKLIFAFTSKPHLPNLQYKNMSNPYYQAGSSGPEVNELPSLPRQSQEPWKCSRCSTINPINQSRCQNPSCGYLNLGLVSQPEIRTGQIPKKEESPPVVNDSVWTCPGCKYEYNMKDQATCTRCQTPKPQAQAPAPSMMYQGLGQNYPSQLPNQSYNEMAGGQMNPGQYQGQVGQSQISPPTGYAQAYPPQPAYSNPGGIPGNPAGSGQYQTLHPLQGTGPSAANPAFSPSPSAGGMAGHQGQPEQFQGSFAPPGINAPAGYGSDQAYPPSSSAGEMGSQSQVFPATGVSTGQSPAQTYPPQPLKPSPAEGISGNLPNPDHQSTNPQQGRFAYPPLQPSINAAGLAGTQASAIPPYQASSIQPEGQTVEVRANIVLSKDGWVCESCKTRNQVYLNYCSACNQFNSICVALMQQYQTCFGSSQ